MFQLLIRSRARRVRARRSLVAVATLLVLSSLAAAEGAPGRWKRPPFDAVLEREAGRLGLDEAALARIRAVADAARPEIEQLESALRGERHALHELLSKDTPDQDAAMLQIERVGAADTALEKRRISTMLEIRQLLTPAQRAELVKVFRERKAEREQRQRGERH
jgi:Spy/CpxP family protein refolding chaperone